MGLFVRNNNPCAALLNLIICGCVVFLAVVLAIFIKIWYFEQTHTHMNRMWDVMISDDFWHFDALTWTLLAVSVLVVILSVHLCTGCLFWVFEGIMWTATCQWSCAAARQVRKWRARKKKTTVDLESLLQSSDEENSVPGNSRASVQSAVNSC